MQNDSAKILNSISVTPDKKLDEFVTENGVHLKLHKVREIVITDAVNRIPLPTPPVVYIPEKEREEPNPNDPSYKAEFDRIAYDRGILATNVLITMGTNVLFVPPNVEPIESTTWSEDIEQLTGLTIPNRGRGRYLAWLKYYVLTDVELLDLMQRVQRFSGAVPEAAVTEAIESFRDNSPRDSNTKLSVNETDQ